MHLRRLLYGYLVADRNFVREGVALTVVVSRDQYAAGRWNEGVDELGPLAVEELEHVIDSCVAQVRVQPAKAYFGAHTGEEAVRVDKCALYSDVALGTGNQVSCALMPLHVLGEHLACSLFVAVDEQVPVGRVAFANPPEADSGNGSIAPEKEPVKCEEEKDSAGHSITIVTGREREVPARRAVIADCPCTGRSDMGNAGVLMSAQTF